MMNLSTFLFKIAFISVFFVAPSFLLFHCIDLLLCEPQLCLFILYPLFYHHFTIAYTTNFIRPFHLFMSSSLWSALHLKPPSLFVALTDSCVLLPPEEGYVKMFLKGRPVTMFMPRDQVEPYCLEAKADLPGSKLKLDWVYPLPWW